MSRDDMIALARQAGIKPEWIRVIPALADSLERFATLAVDTERESCAQLADDMVLYTGLDVATAIRQRGES
jgi:hypothetical protein